MTSIYTDAFRLAEGDVVEFPEEIGRKSIEHADGTVQGGTTRGVVVGHGERSKYVLLTAPTGAAEIPDGAEILGVDITTSTLWYAIPRSEYGGEQ